MAANCVARSLGKSTLDALQNGLLFLHVHGWLLGCGIGRLDGLPDPEVNAVGVNCGAGVFFLPLFDGGIEYFSFRYLMDGAGVER